jgi:uncharacterized cupredoxin-like copper-binding protein
MRRNQNCNSKLTLIAAMSLTLLFSGGVLAAGSHSGGHGHSDKHSNAAGEQGRKQDVVRTIDMVMTDNRYAPENIRVTAGETVRFIVRNKGELVHEFNIGTPEAHKEHQKEMMMMLDHGVLEADRINHDRMKMKMPDGSTMEHNDPNSVLLEPGKNQEIIWKFSKSGKFEFACNVPGHYDAGMVGDITVN